MWSPRLAPPPRKASRGLPSLAGAGWCQLFSRSLGFGTWNAHGLLARCRRARAKKLNYLRSLLGKTDVVCVQEAHVWPGETDVYLRDLLRDFVCLFSHGDFRNKGGLLFVCRRSAFHPGAKFELGEIIPGRAASLRISWGSASLVFLGAHLVDWSAPDADRFNQEVKALHASVSLAPRSSLAFVLGDWNFIVPGEVRAAPVAPSAASPLHSPPSAEDTARHSSLWSLAALAVDLSAFADAL